MFTVIITQGESVVYTSKRLGSRRAIRKALRAYIAKAGRRSAQHAHVRVEGPGVVRSFRMATCAAYKSQPRVAA